MPPVPPLWYLVEWLFEVGPVSSVGMGPTPLTWGELAAWASLVSAELGPLEARSLRRLSKEYVTMLLEAEKPECRAPWSDPSTESSSVSDDLARILDGIMTRRENSVG